MQDKDQESSSSQPVSTPREFFYLYRLIRYRIRQAFSRDKNLPAEPEPEMPPLDEWQPPLSAFVKEELMKEGELEKDKAIVLLIGMAPYVIPDLFDIAVVRELTELDEDTRDFMRIGGARGANCRFFLPTGETALFLIGGKDILRREKVQEIFGAECIFWSKKILWLEDMQNAEPPMHGRIIMSQDYVDLLTIGVHKSPQFSISFPAKKISSAGTEDQPAWDQLVINEDLQEQINEIRSWLKYNEKLIKEFGKDRRFREGYRTLFFGPPGTGKTFTAKLLGTELGRDVYKIDLSMVVSKYIGETEKNLELLFARAEDKKWILFFDEADALFGKRTNVRDAHDKYANQEVSYLLQRIEDYKGLIILATNMKNNIDDAFVRRFNSILKFPVPNSDERKLIWEKLFPKDVIFLDDPELSSPNPKYIPEIVKAYELTGGNICNVVHYACLKAYERRSTGKDPGDCADTSKLTVYLEDVLNGIRRELIKEGRPFGM